MLLYPNSDRSLSLLRISLPVLRGVSVVVVVIMVMLVVMVMIVFFRWLRVCVRALLSLNELVKEGC